MVYRYRYGWHIFTASSLRRMKVFASFREGIRWVFIQKIAAACAEALVVNHE